MDYTLTQIRAGAIPSIKVKNQKAVMQQQIKNNEVSTHPHNEETSDFLSTVEKLSQISEKVVVGNLRSVDDLDNYFKILYGCITEQKTCTTITFPMKSDSAPLGNFIPVATHSESGTSTVNVSSTPKRTLDTTLAEKSCLEFETPHKKRRPFCPEDISELEISDVATPQSASRVIKFVKEENKRKISKIKELQASQRRLQKRVSSLEGLILSELRKQGKITTEDEEDTMLVILS